MSVTPTHYIPSNYVAPERRAKTSTNQVGKTCGKCGCKVRGPNHESGKQHIEQVKAKR